MTNFADWEQVVAIALSLPDTAMAATIPSAWHWS